MSTYTPGPWYVVKRHKGSEARAVSASKDGLDARQDVCNVINMRGDKDNVIANAHLLAAAPDMYAELKRVETLLMIVEPRSNKGEYLRALGGVRAAIAKATGQS